MAPSQVQIQASGLLRSLVVILFCLATGVSRQQAQGQGIWSIFQLPSGRGKPEELYIHPIRESLEFSVVAIATANQQRLSLTFRCVNRVKQLVRKTCSLLLFLAVAFGLCVFPSLSTVCGLVGRPFCLLCLSLSVCLCLSVCLSVCLHTIFTVYT